MIASAGDNLEVGMSYMKILLMGFIWMNISCDLTAGSWVAMSGSIKSIGYLDLVKQTNFLAWVWWTWSDST